MSTDQQVAALFKRLRQDAILLHRPYPPYLAEESKSKFGGLPNLPVDVAWPRMKHGTALHFLAQIDCSRLPFRCELPDRGMLFFFGLDDGEQVWDETLMGDKGYRVIYARQATGTDPARPAPPDLAPIGDIYPQPNQRPFVRDGETLSNVHVEWPIELRRMDSWPDSSALTDADLGLPSRHWLERLVLLLDKDADEEARSEQESRLREAYEDALVKRRADAFRAACKYRLAEDQDRSLQYKKDREQAQRIVERAEPHAWPGHWATIDYFCRAIRRAWEFSTREDRSEADIDFLAAATDWIEQANAAGPATMVAEPERTAFRTWALAGPGGSNQKHYKYKFEDGVLEAAIATIRCFAYDRVLAQQIPSVVYEQLAYRFQGNSVWGIQFSQMLGYAPSSQQAQMTDDPDVCLLSLASEAALGWMFGDVGEATFSISPEHLARCAFDAVQAGVEGH